MNEQDQIKFVEDLENRVWRIRTEVEEFMPDGPSKARIISKLCDLETECWKQEKFIKQEQDAMVDAQYNRIQEGVA